MPLDEKRMMSLLGLAAKSGNLVSGEFSTEKVVREHKAKLVVVADDASDHTKKNFRDMCTYYQVPILMFADKEKLGHAIGKQFRASAAVTDEGLAKAVQKYAEADN